MVEREKGDGDYLMDGWPKAGADVTRDRERVTPDAVICMRCVRYHESSIHRSSKAFRIIYFLSVFKYSKIQIEDLIHISISQY